MKITKQTYLLVGLADNECPHVLQLLLYLVRVHFRMKSSRILNPLLQNYFLSVLSYFFFFYINIFFIFLIEQKFIVFKGGKKKEGNGSLLSDLAPIGSKLAWIWDAVGNFLVRLLRMAACKRVSACQADLATWPLSAAAMVLANAARTAAADRTAKIHGRPSSGCSLSIDTLYVHKHKLKQVDPKEEQGVKRWSRLGRHEAVARAHEDALPAR